MTKNWSRVVAAVAAGLCIMTSACSSPDSTNYEPSGGGAIGSLPLVQVGLWTLEWWSDPGELPDVPITLVMSTGLVSGSSGCNSYSGTLTVGEEGAFRTSPLGTTYALCTGATGYAEQTYRFLLQAVTQWSMDGDSLVLGSDGTNLLRFNPWTDS